MKIISFAVNNFRGISGGLENNKVEFNNSNTIFLLGQNNVGKSSFLKAYDFFHSNTSPISSDLFKQESTNQIEFELVLQLDELDLEKSAIKQKQEGLKSWLSESKLLKVKRIIKPKTGKTISFEKAENYTWDFKKGEYIKKNYGGLGLDTVFQSALPKPIFIKAMPTEDEVEKIINTILDAKVKFNLKQKELEELKEAQSKIKELQDKLYNPESISNYKEEVNQHFQELFPNTTIELSEKDQVKWTEKALARKFTILFEKKDDNGEVDETIPTSYNSIGHGAIRSAMFSLLLMKDIADEFERIDNRKDYIVLFEEPELFLHPKLMKQLRNLIYKVSASNTPYQVLCASHSPQMIDITQEKSSLIRMVKQNIITKLFQINDDYLKESKNIKTKNELKQEMNELLRFNPYICESFYTDEVVLVEGPTEEIILRGILPKLNPKKDLFIVNCGTVNNIPFYQKIFSKFNIPYHVICDSDSVNQEGVDKFNLPIFTSGIQMAIYNQFKIDKEKDGYQCGLFKIHNSTFEPAHQSETIPETLRLPDSYLVSDGKPYNANKYWKEILEENFNHDEIDSVPIIKYSKLIVEFQMD